MIKTILSLSYPLVTPELFRLLRKHPDVEIIAITADKDNCGHYRDFFDTLQEEVADIPIVDSVDFDSADLYIGPSGQHLPADSDNLKCIFIDQTDDAVMGICEYNRKSIVRQATRVWQPALPTLLGAIALMPLAKNLMLNTPIVATMLLPVDRLRSRSAFSLHVAPNTTDAINVLKADVLSQLQKSFDSPIDVNCIESTVSSFACAVFNTGANISSAQALEIFKNVYSDHRHIYFPDRSISERMVIGTNKTVITLHNDSLGRLVVEIACDALYKAGAGNIVHILNLLFGLDERTGL